VNSWTALVGHARRVEGGREQGARIQRRRRHLSGEPVAAVRSTACRDTVVALRAAANAQPVAVRRLSRLSRGSRPERVLRVSTDGDVETRPIKGTRPRGFGPEHDAHLGRELTESEKDQAENLMI